MKKENQKDYDRVFELVYPKGRRFGYCESPESFRAEDIPAWQVDEILKNNTQSREWCELTGDVSAWEADRYLDELLYEVEEIK